MASQTSAKVQELTTSSVMSSSCGLKLATSAPGKSTVADQIRSDRQRCGAFDLLHGERGAHVLQRRSGDQAFIEGVIGCDVFDDDFQEIVGLPRHAVEFDDFRQAGRTLGES